MANLITADTFKVTLKVAYPCCGQRARFVALCAVPVETYDRACRYCGKKWAIRRETLFRLKDGSRADKLEWGGSRAI